MAAIAELNYCHFPECLEARSNERSRFCKFHRHVASGVKNTAVTNFDTLHELEVLKIQDREGYLKRLYDAGEELQEKMRNEPDKKKLNLGKLVRQSPVLKVRDQRPLISQGSRSRWADPPDSFPLEQCTSNHARKQSTYEKG